MNLRLLIGYARVSKTLDLQRDALRAAGGDDMVNVDHDLTSGVRAGRPGTRTATCEPWRGT